MEQQSGPIRTTAKPFMAAEFVTQLPLLVPGSAVLPVGTAPSGKEQQNTPISGAPPTLMCKELTTVSCQNDQLQEEEEEQQANHVFDVRNSVSQLCNLSDALSDFRRCYEELQQHIDFVKSSIDAQLAQSQNSESPPLPPPAIAASNGIQSQNLQKPMNANLGHTEIEPISQSLAIVSYDGTQLQGPMKTPTADQGLSEIESISKSMRGRGLRKYVVTHFSDIPKLRAELPAALKLAPYPGRLVLSSCGRVFQHGRNMLLAVTTTMKAVLAIVLILESFLLMGSDGNKNKIAAAGVKKEAQSNARKWIKRLKDEGGVDKAVEIDARALLLFIGCFSIAGCFKNKDVTSLIQRANAMEISGALRNSAFLLAKIPALIEWMIRRNKELDAVNIVAVFALENQFPPQTMLTSFLKKSNETWAKSRGAAHGCIAEVNEANKKKLADLKCVLKCLENYNLDPVKLLTEWGIHENISSLEKDIAVSDKTLEKEQQQLNLKRKADEAEVPNKLKQTRVSDYNNTVTEETPNGGITARLTSNTYPQNSESPPLPPPAIAASNGTQSQNLQKPMIANLGHTEIEPISQSLEIVSYDGTQLQGPKKTPTADQGLSEIESISKSMRGRGLRNYVITHISDIPKLRAEIPAALKLAPNPGRLVLNSFGKFYLQGRKTLTADTPIKKAVQAMILILESFLLMGGAGDENKIGAAVKKGAECEAEDWIKRLKDEGGVDKVVEIDARALLLFIGCFCIPVSLQHIINLIQGSNAMEISGALRNSAFLLAKIPEMMEWLIERNKELEAINIVAVFGQENQYPPQTMLTSFLKKSNETWARSRGAAHGCIIEVNEANKKKLADLKCVLKCLENYNLDPVKLLTEWGIHENISSLEKDIAVSEKTLEKEQQQLNLKRKADEAEVPNKLKQTRVSDYNNTVTEETPNGGITARLTSNTYPQNSESPPLPPPAIAASNGTQSQNLQKPMIANLGHTEIEPISQSLEIVSYDGTQLQGPKKTPTADQGLSEIESISKSMRGRGLRNYVITHISDIPKLRAEIPAALKLAPNPGRLVLNSFGKFYLQGRKTLTADTPIKKAVQAMILILESFLLMGGAGDENKIGAAVKKGAECEAEDWIKRLKDEGGVDKVVEIDARALLLFIGCFCIPVSLQHIINLIQGSNAMEISGALRNSAFLLAKIPEMMEWMIERNKELEAINIVAVFGQEKQYPPQTMVTSFLKKSNDTWARSRGAAHGCMVEVNEANKKKLADLKCVLKCLENYNLDTEWGIQENISSLERDIAVSDKTLEKEQQMKLKPKADEGEVSNKLKQTPNGGITARVTSKELQLPTTTGYAYGSGYPAENSSGAGMIHDQMNSNVWQWPLTSYAVENGSGAGFPLHMNNGFHHSSSAAFHASPFPHSGVGFGAGPLAGGSYAGGIHTSFVDMNDSLPYRWHREAAAAREERFVDAVPASFPGLLNLSPPSLGVSGQKSSDIYQFADAVL